MRTTSRFARFPATLITLLLCTLSLSRSADAATVTGRALDPDGRPVPGVRIVATTPVGITSETTTDRTGTYTLDGLPAGRYDIHVVIDGFSADAASVELGTDAERRVDFALRMSAVVESVVVSAAQIDVPLSEAADRVTVLTAKDLAAHQVESVADALRLVPGLTVTRSGGRGAITSIFPRGGESDFTLVLVDGMRVNSFGGGFDFGHLSVGDIDRIEVVSSPQSALYGADAIGGVVQIVTRRGGAPRLDAVVEGGSESTARTSVSAGGSHGAWTFGGGAEYRRSAGFTGTAPASGETVSNDDDRVAHASGSIGWQQPGGTDVLVTGNISQDERGFPGPYGSDPAGLFPGVDRVARGTNDTRQIGARVLHPWSSRVRQRLEANYTDLAGTFASAFGPSESGTRRFEARVQEDLALGGPFGASAGVQFMRERGSSTYVTDDSGAGIPVRRGLAGAFAELRYGWRERLSVTGGLRADRITRDAVPGNAFGFPPRPPFADQAITSTNPKIAVTYLVTAPGSRVATRVHASAGTGIRPPDAFEIAFTDNPDLRPERSRSIDAGIEQQIGPATVGATAFFTRYDDLIVTLSQRLTGISRYYSDNISNARARGLEITGRARPSSSLTIDAAYTFLDTAILAVDDSPFAPPPFAAGDPLIRRPRHQGHVDVTYARGRVTAFGQVLARGATLDVEPNYGTFGGLFANQGYTVANAGASVRIARQLEAYGRVENLAGRQYEEVLGYPALGRSLVAGLRIAASR